MIMVENSKLKEKVMQYLEAMNSNEKNFFPSKISKGAYVRKILCAIRLETYIAHLAINIELGDIIEGEPAEKVSTELPTIGRIIVGAISFRTHGGLPGHADTLQHMVAKSIVGSPIAILFVFAANLLAEQRRYIAGGICYATVMCCLTFYVCSKMALYLFLSEPGLTLNNKCRYKGP